VFSNLAHPPATMVAETASIAVGGQKVNLYKKKFLQLKQNIHPIRYKKVDNILTNNNLARCLF
jgi:hypothetical protein